MFALKQLKWQLFYKTGRYPKIIYIGEYSAKFNTNISMPSLHKDNWNYNFSVKQDTTQRKFILEYIELFEFIDQME